MSSTTGYRNRHEPACPSEIKKVAVIGPESTGKSELSQYLAGVFDTVWVPEYARAYLDKLAGPYGPSDLLNIARGQISLEDSLMPNAHRVLICDTDLYVIKIWSMFKYGDCHPQILEWMTARTYDLYLLTYIDIPWEADPYREHPDQREVLYQLYLNEMRSQPVPFEEVRGGRSARQKIAVDSVKRLLRGGYPSN